MTRTTVDKLVARRLNIAESFSRQDLEAAQLDLLKRKISHLAGLPFYRKKGFGNGQLRSLTDLSRFPFTTGDDLRYSESGLLAVSQSRVARVITMQTSGSTGPPKRLFFSKEDLRAIAMFFQMGMRNLIDRNDRVLVLLPWELPASVGQLLIDALAQDGVYSRGMWPPGSAGYIANLIEKEQISCVVGLPHHLLAISSQLEPGILKSMLLCSDYASPCLRKSIERCGCKTFLHYGSIESGLGGAVECSCHDGCHVRESDLLVEIVDPSSGLPLDDGEVGELVITSLQRTAMPLIRYRTHDLAALDRRQCECGGITSRLKHIRGRLDGRLAIESGIISSPDLDDVLYLIPGLLDYRATIHDHDGEVLDIAYTSHDNELLVKRDIYEKLLENKVISAGVLEKKLTIGKIEQVQEFPADHRFKRTVIDQRKGNGSHEIYSRGYH